MYSFSTLLCCTAGTNGFITNHIIGNSAFVTITLEYRKATYMLVNYCCPDGCLQP